MFSFIDYLSLTETTLTAVKGPIQRRIDELIGLRNSRKMTDEQMLRAIGELTRDRPQIATNIQNYAEIQLGMARGALAATLQRLRTKQQQTPQQTTDHGQFHQQINKAAFL